MGHSVLFLLLILMLNVLYENTREQKAKAPRSCVLIKNLRCSFIHPSLLTSTTSF